MHTQVGRESGKRGKRREKMPKKKEVKKKKKLAERFLSFQIYASPCPCCFFFHI